MSLPREPRVAECLCTDGDEGVAIGKTMMKVMFLSLWLIAVVSAAGAMTPVSGDLLAEAQRLEGFSSTPYGADSGSYVGPTPAEWAQFSAAAAALFAGDLALAESTAAPLAYQLILFTHVADQRTYVVLRARETNGVPVKPWGTYFVNTNAAVTASVGAPHPQSDFRSPRLAAEIFVKSGMRGFMMAGAHRNANGSNTADPGYLTNTVFHAVHAAWSGAGGENTAWQIHGYSAANHPEFPGNCMAVLSTGDNAGDSMSSNVVTLDQQMEWNSVKTYAYNDSLAATNALNQLVNEGVAGTNFASLAATHNVQGKASRARGGTFVHIELVTVVRTNAVIRTHAADAIANAILRSRTNAPLRASPAICAVASVTNQLVFASTNGMDRTYKLHFRARGGTPQ
jgi:hypothetical protein